jgi:hypothetical protein
MQLLGRAKFLTEEKNPKGKVNFLKGANFLKGSQFPKGGDITRNFAPRGGGEIVGGGGEIPGTPALSVILVKLCRIVLELLL